MNHFFGGVLYAGFLDISVKINAGDVLLWPGATLLQSESKFPLSHSYPDISW